MSAPHVPTVRGLAAVFLGLILLTALTVSVSFADLGPWNDFLALAIAGAKALLVVLFFMHARRAEPLVWIFAGVGLLWLLILLTLTLADFDTRQVLAPWVE
jgi:cytochrome c oxidase subunit IV